MERAVLIYDGDCTFCQSSKRWIERRMIKGEFEFLPCQSEERRVRFPQITAEACMTALQLVLPNGQVHAGADAVPEILKRLKGWRRLATLFNMAPVRKLAPMVYGWVARHRYFISCMLPGGHFAGGEK